MPSNESLTLIKQNYLASRTKAVDQFHISHNPDLFLHALCHITDSALISLLEHFPLPSGAVLAAVGGYGRGELYPFSDVDLLILLAHEPEPADQEQLSDCVTALWDIGLEPGYSVRTISQCIEEANADITVETSLLESRFITGDAALFKTFERTMLEQLDPRAFFQAKLAEMKQRHGRYQDTAYALEPNCKESPGGLRDLQVILWLARASGFGSNWQHIANAGVLTAVEARDLRRAENAFKRLRIEMHLIANRREDRVVFDLQNKLASQYHIEPTTTRRASEILMQRYYWAARLVTQLNTILVETIGAHLFPPKNDVIQMIDKVFIKCNDHLDIAHENVFHDNPQELLRVFLVMQQHPDITELSARALRSIWHARTLINAAFRLDPVNQQNFIRILQQPQGIVHALRRMNTLNILPRYLPVFRRIVGQMQHDLFHAYTVDQHTLQVIRNLRRFTMPEHAQEYPLASKLAAGLSDFWLLYTAALFHDIAKGRGGDHSTLGTLEVRRFAKTHHLSKPDTELISFLVQNHLLMSQVAQKQDLSDPEVIHSFALKVGNLRQLTALYLLTVADIRGTSPIVWNAWKGKLLEDVFNLTRAALGSEPENTETVLQQRMNEAARLTRLAGLQDSSRDVFWGQVDIAYFLRHDAPDIAWHTRQLYYRSSPEKAIVKTRPTLGGDGIQVMVYVKDQQDLFARICTFLGTHHLNIQDARIHTTRHGYALDSFIVLPSSNESNLRTQSALIEHELAQALNQTVETIKPFSAGKVRTSRQSRAFPFIPKVDIQPDERNQNWRLAIVATDRPGLLADVARIFVDFHVSLETAKVMTLGERVEDIFVVKGEALQKPRLQRQFQTALFEALALENHYVQPQSA
jgi:[protein-PII] uridylyltransferase